MALPVAFDFTGTDGATLQATSANWTLVDGQMSINTNQLVNDDPAVGESAYYWNADVFNATHYAEATYTAAGTRRIGVGVCMAGTSYYGFYGFNAGSYGEKNLVLVNAGGAPDLLGTDSTRIFVNDVIRLTRGASDLLTAAINGVTASFGAVTDATISGGSAGVVGRGQSTVARIDNFAADNVGGAPPPATNAGFRALMGVGR